MPRKFGASERSAAAGRVLPLAGVAVILLVSLLVAAFILRRSFAVQNDVRQAQSFNDRTLTLQLDEETGLRGFIATRQPLFLEPYYQAQARMGPTLDELTAVLSRIGARDFTGALDGMRGSNQAWLDQVARGAIAANTVSDARQFHGKVLVDRFRVYNQQVASALATALHEDELETTLAALGLSAVSVISAVVVLVGVGFMSARQNVLEGELVRERSPVETLQRAFISRTSSIPNVAIGSAYLAAGDVSKVGGDLFDVHRLDEHRVCILIADISGKGLNAAVDTALVKYTVGALSAFSRDPRQILEDLNRRFIEGRSEEDAFLAAFLGVLDTRTLQLEYASAGHGSAYLRRRGQVEALEVTGALVGLSHPADYAMRKLALAADDMLVLATDGLTEARGPAGEILTPEGAMKWIGEIATNEPQVLVDRLVDRIYAFGAGSMKDDLALLALRPNPPATAGSHPPHETANV